MNLAQGATGSITLPSAVQQLTVTQVQEISKTKTQKRLQARKVKLKHIESTFISHSFLPVKFKLIPNLADPFPIITLPVPPKTLVLY